MPTLTKLSLDISLENLDSLCSASFQIARLEHLHLNLHSDHTLSSDSLTYILKARLARSISSLAPYLRLLSIEAHEPVDIGPFFAGLDFLGKLDTLALAMPLQKPHLGNPKALGRFLRSQAQTIKVLRLRVTQHDAGSTGPGSHWRTIGTADPWSLNSWVQTAFGTEAGGDFQDLFDEHDVPEPLGEYEMDVLESLEVGSNLLPLETALYCAERFGSKVRSLSLLGGTKSFEFVKELVKVLRMGNNKLSSVAEEDGGVSTPETLGVNTNLRTLRVGTIPLSPELLDVLAHNLSNLRHLRLIVKHFLPSQDAVPIYGSSRIRGDGDGVQLEEQVVSRVLIALCSDRSLIKLYQYEFLETMQNDWSWPSWGLETLSVYSDSATLSSPLSLPLRTSAQPAAPKLQETTPTASPPVVPFPIPARSSKVPLLTSSFASSVITVTDQKDATITSTSSTLELPETSVSAPITRYPTPSIQIPPHPSSLLDLPCSYSMSALPPPISLNDEPTVNNEEARLPLPLVLRPTLQLSSASTPSSPIDVSYEISPVSYVHLPSASTSALPASSSYTHMHDDDNDDDGFHRPMTSHGEGVSRGSGGMRGSVFGKNSRSQSASFTTPSSPLSASASTSANRSTTSRGSHSPMFSFLRPGARSRKEKGVRGKRALTVDSLNTAFSATSVPISSSGSERQEDVFERALRNSNHRCKVGRSEARTPNASRNGNSTSDEISTTTSIPAGDVGFDPRGTNEKGRKEKKKSSGLYALAFRVRDHNRHWQKEYSRSSPSSSTSSLSPATTTQQKDVVSNGRLAERGVMEKEKEKEMQWDLDWDRAKGKGKERRKEKRRKPLTSAGSLSSISGLSEYSTGGGRSDEGDASFAKHKDDLNLGVGEVEERITLEVALDEILTRCLPGVRVVR